MYCPQCRSEYRPGFTVCSDCGIDLVDHLIEHANPAGGSRNAANGPRTTDLFLAITDEQYFQAILEVLDESQIRCEHEVRMPGAIPGLMKKQFCIFVEPREQDAAKAAVAKFEAQFALAAEDGDGDSEATDLANDIVPDDFDPADATAEVWHGDDLDQRDVIISCLNGVGIGCATDRDEVHDEHTNQVAAAHKPGGNANPIFVLPRDEKRAKEIVREIVTGGAPE